MGGKRQGGLRRDDVKLPREGERKRKREGEREREREGKVSKGKGRERETLAICRGRKGKGGCEEYQVCEFKYGQR